jgi:nitrogen fixation/metabolism regulation signal transduction histidine kinase
MAITALKRLFTGVTPVIVLAVLLFVSLYLISDATHSSTQFGKLYTYLFVVNGLAIFFLVWLILKNLYQLLKQLRQQATGSRLTARLVVLFIVLSFTPTGVVYYFSLDFLQRGIDSWFDVRVQRALDDSLELSQASLGLRMRDLLHQTQSLTRDLTNIPNDLAGLTLNDLRERTEASEITLFTNGGQIIASSSAETAKLVPLRLDETTQMRLKQGNDDVAMVPLQDGGLYIRAAVLVPGPDAVSQPRILQALYPISERMNELANTVQSAFSQFREIVYLRKPLKTSFILTLSLVLLLSLLAAIWAAFFFARRLVAPIADLVEGTRAVAAGNYAKRLPLPSRDELGFLVRSFNEMTERIDQATAEARLSQQQLAEQHAYLEVVLAHLSSGVITIDTDMCLHTANATAGQILNVDIHDYTGKPLDTLVHDYPQMLIFVDMIYAHLDNQETEWREELMLFNTGGRQVLMCRGSELPGSGDKPVGYVVVFDDITNLVQAQRNAAWGEVARRLAHEIKNPLTPIQLSAERLRHKYLAKMDPKDAEVLDRSTHTIVQQVETLKAMVKAFSDYARMPELQMQPIDLNGLINEVLDLYRDDNQRTRFRTRLDPSMPRVEADQGRLRQLLNNLIKNSIEAMSEDAEPAIDVSTQCMEKEACRFVEIRVTDNGPGIPEDLFGQLFDPYVTTKPRGTGLGLAIVKKIVEEHSGMIWAENKEHGGAMIIIRLPVLMGQVEGMVPMNQDDDSNAAA